MNFQKAYFACNKLDNLFKNTLQCGKRMRKRLISMMQCCHMIFLFGLPVFEAPSLAATTSEPARTVPDLWPNLHRIFFNRNREINITSSKVRKNIQTFWYWMYQRFRLNLYLHHTFKHTGRGPNVALGRFQFVPQSSKFQTFSVFVW